MTDSAHITRRTTPQDTANRPPISLAAAHCPSGRKHGELGADWQVVRRTPRQLGPSNRAVNQPQPTPKEQPVERTERQHTGKRIRQSASTLETRRNKVPGTKSPPKVVEITPHDRWSPAMQLSNRWRRDEPEQLLPALRSGQTEMHVVDNERPLVSTKVHADVDLHHPASFPPSDGEVHVGEVGERPPRHDQVSIAPHSVPMLGMEGRMQSERTRQHVHLVMTSKASHSLRNFLKQDHIGIEVTDHRNGATQIVAAVEPPHPLVNIPRHHPQVRLGNGSKGMAHRRPILAHPYAETSTKLGRRLRCPLRRTRRRSRAIVCAELLQF